MAIKEVKIVQTEFWHAIFNIPTLRSWEVLINLYVCSNFIKCTALAKNFISQCPSSSAFAVATIIVLSTV